MKILYIHVIVGGRDLTYTNYTNWFNDDYADNILSTEPKCMQLLSGTIYEGLWMPFACEDSFFNRALCQLK